ncbi:MAG: flippase-like domain-containing protein [candidate division Zixibacteria bacterium]|nr:flippase-like domain-containing protein [candidate division Zixibacteria bacterium]
MNYKAKKVFKYFIQSAILLLIFYFIGRQIIANWDKVITYSWQINYYLLAASLISVMFTFFVFSSVWKIVLGTLGRNISYPISFKIAYLANLGRYIPGKIWQMFGVIYLAKREGVTEEEAVTIFGLSQIFAIPSCFLVSGLFLLLHPASYEKYAAIPYFSTGLVLAIVAIIVLSGFVVFYPKPLETILNKLFVLLKRKPISIQINKFLAIKIYAGYFLCWTLYGFSFWLFVRAISEQAAPMMPMIAIFLLAYQIGYLVLFAPGGVGPREAMMEIMLMPFFGAGVASAIAIAARLWLIVAEAISALIALRIKSSEKSSGE